jgi:hypothetical protein
MSEYASQCKNQLPPLPDVCVPALLHSVSLCARLTIRLLVRASIEGVVQEVGL